MKRFYSLKHAKETIEKLAICKDHDNGKILISVGGAPVLLKEANNSVLDSYISYPSMSVVIKPSTYFVDTYREAPSGAVLTFIQDSMK